MLPKKKRFVHKGSGSSTFVFMVPGDGCGTESVAGKLNFSFHNVLVFQIEDNHQEAWENSRQIQCLFKSDTQSVAFQPPLSVVDGKNEEIRTQVVIGTGIDGPPVNQTTRIKIGDPVTLLFYISQDYADMFVKNCFASDGLTNRVQLTDSNGWTLRPKLLKNFRRTDNIVHASMTAFRIADSAKLSFSCEVELCLEMCNNPTTYTAEFYPFITTKPPATVTSLPPTDPPIHSILPPYRPTVDPWVMATPVIRSSVWRILNPPVQNESGIWWSLNGKKLTSEIKNNYLFYFLFVTLLGLSFSLCLLKRLLPI